MMHHKLHELLDTMRSNKPTKDQSVTQSFLQRSKPDYYCQEEVDDDTGIKLVSAEQLNHHHSE